MLTTIPFDGIDDYDASNMHDPSANPSRVIVPASGTYLVNVHVEWATNAAGTREIRVRRNGAGGPLAQIVQGPQAQDQELSDQIHLEADDYVEVQTEQSNGGSLNVVGRSFAISRIAP